MKFIGLKENEEILKLIDKVCRQNGTSRSSFYRQCARKELRKLAPDEMVELET